MQMLSSSASALYTNVYYPLLVVFCFILLVTTPFSLDNWSMYAGLLLLSAFSLSQILCVKIVQYNGKRFVISSIFGDDISIDNQEIAAVSGSLLIRPELVWIKLKSPCKYGKTIFFIPHSRTFPFSTHPVVEKLRNELRLNQKSSVDRCE